MTALVLSHNQRYIMTGGGEGDVRVWELRSRELVSHLKVRQPAFEMRSPVIELSSPLSHRPLCTC